MAPAQNQPERTERLLHALKGDETFGNTQTQLMRMFPNLHTREGKGPGDMFKDGGKPKWKPDGKKAFVADAATDGGARWIQGTQVAPTRTLVKPASDGDAGQVLSTDGAGVTSWVTSGGLYNAWLIKTTTYTALSGDQLIANAPTTAFSITLPASPSAGDTVSLKNVGAALLTVARNGSNINSTASDATMPTGNAAQLVFVDSTIGWTVL